MSEYKILLTDELEDAYKNVADSLDISMEQTLMDALQLFMERLTLSCYSQLADNNKLRGLTKQ